MGTRPFLLLLPVLLAAIVGACGKGLLGCGLLDDLGCKGRGGSGLYR